MKIFKKYLCLFLSMLLTAGMLSGCRAAEYPAFAEAGASDIRVVTFNCAAPWGNLLDGTASAKRVKRFAAYMNSLLPDSIGTQEMNSQWLEKLSDSMPLYDSYGIVRGGDESENKSEMNAVLWRKDKYTLMDKGTFWLSETPEAESIYTGAGCYRICTWVLLKDNDTGFQYIHMNTHLDNASEDAANYGAEVIVQKMGELTAEYSEAFLVLTGDFNETDDMQAYAAVSAVLTDARASAGAPKAPTYHDWGKIDSGAPIDYIFMSKSGEAGAYYRLDDVSNGYVSDHYGLMADISVR